MKTFIIPWGLNSKLLTKKETSYLIVTDEEQIDFFYLTTVFVCETTNIIHWVSKSM